MKIGRPFWPLMSVLLGLSLGGCSALGGAADDGQREPTTASDQSDGERRARVRLELASAYFSRGQLDTALDEVKLSINAKADLHEAYNLRGLIYAALGESSLAESSFKRALTLNPRDGDAMHNFAWFMCQAQRYADADALFGQALAQPQYRGTARSLLARGLCLARAGQWLQAEGVLMRGYELEPNNPSMAINLAEVLYRRADYERARVFVGRVNSQLLSVNPQTLWLAARIEHKLGNLVREREFGIELISRFPKSPEAALYEGKRFDE